ncbi:MAG: TetR/AcrR family transcriptional regulator [Pseudomonadota bacterium]
MTHPPLHPADPSDLSVVSAPEGSDTGGDSGVSSGMVPRDGRRVAMMRKEAAGAATRRMLLDAAFAEIRHAGFAGASIARILDKTGVTKGALYHHFSGKAKLGHAVIEECLPDYINTVWLDPLTGQEDVLPVLMAQVDILGSDAAPAALDGGCPLARFAAEAADLDDNLRRRIDGAYRHWRRGLAGHISRSQFGHFIRTDAEPASVAEFIIATLHGFLTRPPSLRSNETHAAFSREFARYLNSLRP